MKAEEQLQQSTGNVNARIRHYVKLDERGKPSDTAECGYVWDQLHVPHNGEICQECIDIVRKKR